MKLKNKNIKPIIEVLVAYHKDSLIITTKGYHPIHVGAEISQTYLPFLRDDSSVDNISKLNNEFCELTATYWAWKNSKAEIIGINHYRRVFTNVPSSKNENFKYLFKKFILNKLKVEINDKSNFLNKTDFNFQQLDADQLSNLMKENTLIVPDKFYLNKTVKDHFLFYGDYISILQEVVSGSQNVKFKESFFSSLKKKYLFPCNVIISNRENFAEYCEIIFPILFKHYEVCQLKGLKYNRIAGFMGEVLTNAYIQYKKNQYYKLKKFKLSYLDF